jgi:gamma-glutamylcyclotransferase (GGCT)/AIG2-like uncharacterized protein YtfP
MREYLFLYGTLLPEKAPDDLASVVRRFRPVGRGQIRGRLYDFGDFPGAILDPSSGAMIQGQLVQLPADRSLLRVLDKYEEFDRSRPKASLFVRKKADVKLSNGRSLKGWVYVYNRDPGDAPLVRGGDYSKVKVA